MITDNQILWKNIKKFSNYKNRKNLLPKMSPFLQNKISLVLFPLKYIGLVLAQNHFIRCIVDLGVDFYDILSLRSTFLPNFWLQTTTNAFLQKKKSLETLIILFDF